MSKKIDLVMWTEATMIAALGMALSFIPIQSLNAGLDLSLGIVPLILFSFRRGLVPGMMAGFMWGLLNILIGTAMRNFISVPQIILEYPFAFAFGGVGGIFSLKIQKMIGTNQIKATYYVVLGSFLAVISRWFWHFWAGVFVWGAYAPEGQSPYLYSFILNGSSAVINTVYAGVVLGILVRVAPSLFVPKGLRNKSRF